MGGGELFRGVLRSRNLLAQHVAERIQEQENKQEEKGVQKCERCQASAWVNDNAKDFLCSFGGVLQNVPRIQPHKATDVNAETT